MRNLKRNLQITLYVMVVLSSILLGWGMEMPSIAATALAGATLGFIITDCLNIFRLTGIIANIVSLAVLFVAMGNFFGVDGAGKLTAVATLLTYLVTVLMFQEKTPRLNWQLLVLSLLQVVLSAIFSLDFEAGLLFFCYFLVIGAVIFQQSIFIQHSEVEKQNIASALAAEQDANESAETSDAAGLTDSLTTPLVFHDSHSQYSFDWPALTKQLSIWSFLAFAFTATLFQLTPRNARPWYGPAAVAETTTAGVSKSVDLDERGQISLSQRLMMRVQFLTKNGRPLQPSGVPYFRGIALSNLVIRNGKTDFQAPYDRVDQDHYQPPPPSRSAAGEIIQSFTIEESADPLIYGAFPFYAARQTRQRDGTPDRINFCHELSALTRCPLRASMEVRQFKYNAVTVLNENSQFPKSWPYIANTIDYREQPMAEDQPQQAWLTQMDPARYPTLTQISDQIAAQVKSSGGDRKDLILAIENFFLTPGRFKYTLDYTDIKRDEKLDPVEDFVRNHRSGHCETFAAATTLMLRHQGIPARLVVGYCGGEYNHLSSTFIIRASHAHAWVEAYLRPEDCSDAMLNSGLAGPGGAWTVVESTPAMSDAVVENSDDEAMDLARNVWEDYVIGNDSSSNPNASGSPVYGWLRHLNLEWWGERVRRFETTINQPVIKYGFPAMLGLLSLVFLLRSYLRSDESQAGTAKVGLLRRLVAKAVSLVSPDLAKWVIGRRNGDAVEFYQSMEQILASHNLYREPTQTHREFAGVVLENYSEHPKFEVIQTIVADITQRFNQVRFGNMTFDEETTTKIQSELVALKTTLAMPRSQS